MDAKFVSIVERLVADHGKEALFNAAKSKALLNDYAQNEFEKERRLLLIAIEAGAAQEIANASDLAACKKRQIRSLRDDRFIDEAMATKVVDLLALVLCADRFTPITASTPQSQSQNQPLSQQIYVQTNLNANVPKSGVIDWVNNAIKTILGVGIGVISGVIVGFAVGWILFVVVYYVASDGLLPWDNYFGTALYMKAESARRTAKVGAISGIIAGLITAFYVGYKCLPAKVKNSVKNW
ncbi:MAG: hypothetical protein LBQ52_02130 [Helicobacteraceae bacterium]|jgi:hypothetical protein|nr:hypothetical protein [Helicobacteraceae bacterium]